MLRLFSLLKKEISKALFPRPICWERWNERNLLQYYLGEISSQIFRAKRACHPSVTGGGRFPSDIVSLIPLTARQFSGRHRVVPTALFPHLGANHAPSFAASFLAGHTLPVL